jgi:CheY-like chemotaxis protein
VIWLVAEDEADIRVLITTMIHVWGHQAAAFENGQKVWDWLDKLEAGDTMVQPPELVLMDIRMPGKKGNEVAARMRKLPALNRTPIVLMTAYSMTDAERAELLERDGADRVIQKPLPEFEQLRKLLHDLVEARKNAPISAPAVEAASPSPAPEAPAAPEAAEAVPEPAPLKEKVSVPKSV